MSGYVDRDYVGQIWNWSENVQVKVARYLVQVDIHFAEFAKVFLQLIIRCIDKSFVFGMGHI